MIPNDEIHNNPLRNYSDDELNAELAARAARREAGRPGKRTEFTQVTLACGRCGDVTIAGLMWFPGKTTEDIVKDFRKRHRECHE
jgi:hypothetical protein